LAILLGFALVGAIGALIDQSQAAQFDAAFGSSPGQQA
jgi:hypothetical protein